MAKDKYHYQVKEALEKEGWTITMTLSLFVWVSEKAILI
jgi:hypothetical protein